MKLITCTIIALLALAAPAAAARPPIDQARADAKVGAFIAHEVELFNESMIDGEFDIKVVRYEIDPCDLLGRRAECDLTFYFADGDACDGYATVALTRRGKLAADYWVEQCDSIDGDT